jgi:tripartite-type tricarboxylate transporter receptor subunit TctC
MKAMAIIWASFGCLTFTAPAMSADSVADFYRGGQIKISVGSTAGGGYAITGQVVARHLGRFVPGRPAVVAQFDPGASSLNSINFVYSVAPKDGTVIGLPIPTAILEALLNPAEIRFDSRKINWLGVVSKQQDVLAVMRTAPAITLEDAKKTPLIFGSPGKKTWVYMEPMLLNALAGTKIRVVTGYAGTTEINPALERGELHGTSNSWASWVSIGKDWIEHNKLVPLVQVGRERLPELKDVPSLMDFARDDAQAAMVRLLYMNTEMGRVLYAPPGTPADRVAALRQAIADMCRDPDFKEDMRRTGLQVELVRGEELQHFVSEVLETPSEIIQNFKKNINY